MKSPMGWLTLGVGTLLLAFVLSTQTGCDKKSDAANKAGATAQWLVEAGGVLLVVPHPAAKITGAVMILAGGTTKLVLAYMTGESSEVNVPPDFVERVHDELQVQLNDGSKQKVK